MGNCTALASAGFQRLLQGHGINHRHKSPSKTHQPGYGRDGATGEFAIIATAINCRGSMLPRPWSARATI